MSGREAIRPGDMDGVLELLEDAFQRHGYAARADAIAEARRRLADFLAALNEVPDLRDNVQISVSFNLRTGGR